MRQTVPMAPMKTCRFEIQPTVREMEEVMACLCDFCSAPDAGWRHPARSFIGYVAPGVVGESVGDWAACQECHQLIISGNRAGLTERSVLTFIVVHPELGVIQAELATKMGILHAQFFDNRTAPASAIA